MTTVKSDATESVNGKEFSFPVMVDMETIGTETDATIVQIGLVAFDPNTVGKFHSKANIFVDINQGRRIDPQTLKWWLGDKGNPELFVKLVTSPGSMALPEALLKVSMFYNAANAQEIWANSPSFDVAILNSAYRKHTLRSPFHFRGERCYRTMVNVLGISLGEIKERCLSLGIVGTVHNALDDAVHQAVGIQMCYEKMRGGKT